MMTRIVINAEIDGFQERVYLNAEPDGDTFRVIAGFVMRDTDDANDNPPAPKEILDEAQREVAENGPLLQKLKIELAKRTAYLAEEDETIKIMRPDTQ